ncbi:MAG: hypothetical protein MUE69_22970 [Myxococcota bacterium]|nr:hypothetical protein [Myxococcota bacterium]
MGETQNLHGQARVGDAPVAHVASLLPMHLSNAEYEAVAFYDRALRRALNARAEDEAKKRDAKRKAEEATSQGSVRRRR